MNKEGKIKISSKLKGFSSGGDIQQTIANSKFLKNFTTTPYGEFHLKTLNPFNKTNPVHNFGGPNTKLDLRLENYDCEDSDQSINCVLTING